MEKIFANLKKGMIAPCYLLYGEEEYLISETLHKILDIIIPPADRDFGLFYLDGENTDMDSLIENILTPSLFGERKVVVVRNTTLFSSRDDLAQLVRKIRANIDGNPDRAAKYFLTFLKIAGFSLEDLQGSGWQRITDEQWSEIIKGDAGEDRQKWLPRIIEFCLASGLTDASLADKTQNLEEILASGLPPGNCLIFTAEAVDKRKKIYKMIEELGETLHFGRLKGGAAQKGMLQKEAQKLLEGCGKKMSPAAWDALGQKTGFDLRRSISEIEKLISFVGEKTLVEKDDVEEAIGSTKEEEIFALTNALSEKNQLAALAALKNLLDQGIHHLVILNMITREIRLMLHGRLLVDSGKLPKFSHKMEQDWFYRVLYPAFSELGKSAIKGKGVIFNEKPYPVYKTLRNCVRFNTAQLIALLEELLILERSLKSSGASSPQLLLENFLIKSCAN